MEDHPEKRKRRKTTLCLLPPSLLTGPGTQNVEVPLVMVGCNFSMPAQHFRQQMALVVNVLRFFVEDGKLMMVMAF